MHPLTVLMEQLFEEGIAPDRQWTFPTKHLLPAHEREYVLSVLRERFGPSQSLFLQLPPEASDPISSAFYNPRENWFYQLLEKEGYNARVASATIGAWLKGELNTLVLCGDRHSNAKMLFNVISSCFPMAITDSEINSLDTLAEISPITPLYCLPFVQERPNAIMLHFMEGNFLNTVIKGKMRHIPHTSVLIHCSDLSIADSFSSRNTAILYLVQENRAVPACHAPRKELRDLVLNATGLPCLLSIHCKKDHEICDNCIRASPSDAL